MSRKVFSVALIGLLLIHAPLTADSGRRQASPPAKSSSTGKRVAWTLIGAGAGFAAGVFIGLNRFDDAINSDRKVWTTAIVSAIAGGLAGGLLSRNVGFTPPVRPAVLGRQQPDTSAIPWSSALGAASAESEALRLRVRAVNADPLVQ